MTRPGDPSANPQEAKPFLEHLEDLRGTVIRCLVALALGVLVAIPFTPTILSLLKVPLRIVSDNPDQFLRSLEVGGAFSVSMQIALWGGLLLSAPFLLLFLGWFVFPGLTQREKQAVVQAGGFAVGLFAVGVYLGYRLALPAGLKMMFGMHSWLGIRAEWTVTSYVAFATQFLICFGLVFELPAILLVLGKLGLVTSAQLRHFRRHAIVVALIVAALLTPPDVFSQLLMGIPLILLYELCIWMVWATERRHRRAA